MHGINVKLILKQLETVGLRYWSGRERTPWKEMGKGARRKDKGQRWKQETVTQTWASFD
jgi:hypothetical protein